MPSPLNPRPSPVTKEPPPRKPKHILMMEPGIEEKNLYFSGLPSRPRLVARSNFDVIFRPSNGGGQFWPVSKFLSPTSPNHPIVALWDGPLRKDIINALDVDGINWTAIDILRLGFHQDPYRPEQPEPELPHVLLVSVAPNTTWQQGFPAVMSCRRIMELYGLDDIHCEMKESVVERYASTPNRAPPLAPRLTSQSEVLAEPEEQPNVHHRTMASERIGASIASLDSPTREGTKGLYLRRKDTGATLALTCRHVFFQGSELSSELYQHNPDVTPPRLVIQPGSSTLDEILRSAEGQCHVEEDIQSRVEARADYTEERRHTLISESQKRLSSCTPWRDYLQSIAAPESRIIGHILYSPKLSPGISSSGESPHRVRDWALIELHPNKHKTALPDLKNAVTLTRMHSHKMYRAAKDETLGSRGLSLIPIEGFVQLEGIMPEAEIKMPTTMDSHNKEPQLVVAMYGNINKVEVGFSNCIPSILREMINGKVEHSEEWGIIGPKANSSTGSEPFSVPGDSGSCIWDMEGRVAGIVVGGVDVTYAHPIEWLLEDIRTESGIDVELV